MKVKDVMSKNIKSLSPDDYVAKLIPLIEKDHLRQIAIIEKNKFKGIVHSKYIAEMSMRDPSKTKISSLVENAPTISSNQEIEEAANLMFNSNLRILPVTEDKKFVGVLFMEKIIEAVSNFDVFKQTKAEEIMSNPVSILENEDIGKARILMREKNVSRLPVIDKNKKLVGIVTIFDLLKAVKPMNRINFYSMSGEKEKVAGIKVSGIMNKTPLLFEKKTSLSEISKSMTKKNIEGAVIVENDYPVGIISTKDLFESYVYSLGKSGIFYQIIGVDDIDDFTLATVERMIKETIQKASKIFELEFFFLHVKKYHTKGKTKYSIRTRLKTTKKIFISRSYAWDVRDAVGEALDKLERIIIKEKKTYRSRKQQILKFKKFSG
jgi:CBS domain-containing protein